MNALEHKINNSAVLEKMGDIVISSKKELKQLDLSEVKADKSLSLHKLLKTSVSQDNFIAIIKIIDLEHVYMSEAADLALKRCYLTPNYLLDRFGNHYKNNILAEATRGNLKGIKYINTEANEYTHSTDDGTEIAVTGKCVELNNIQTRQIHITCRDRNLAVTTDSVGN